MGVRSRWAPAVALLCTWIASITQPARADFSSELPVDWAGVAEYRIVPGDELRIDFGYDPIEAREVFSEVHVRSDGRITLFPVGDVVAAGHTTSEVDSMVTQMLRGELRRPKVTVTLTKPAASQVHVLGQVDKPGSYAIEGFTSVLQAISRAGGFKDDAARNSVLVFHREGPANVKVARIAVDRLLKQARFDQDFVLGRYDIVYVPRSTIGNINVFSRQFFGEQGQALSTLLVGWELFNLDRVFVIPNTR